MRCLYCHNPDSQKIGAGKEMSTDEILEGAHSVREFLRNGGITATGGEPLMQPEFLTELFKKAKEKYRFHTCLDTSGICFNKKNIDQYKEIMNYTDLVMLDIKHINPDEHIKLTNQRIDNILEFARFVSESGTPIWIRHVLVPGITQDDYQLYQLGRFIGTLKTLKAIDVLPYHDMGKSKYEALGIPYPLPDTPIPSKSDVVNAREVILSGIRDTLRAAKKE